MTTEIEPLFTPYIGVAGEGQRFGVMSCRQCGAALIVGLLEPDGFDPAARHIEWHDSAAGHSSEGEKG